MNERMKVRFTNPFRRTLKINVKDISKDISMKERLIEIKGNKKIYVIPLTSILYIERYK